MLAFINLENTKTININANDFTISTELQELHSQYDGALLIYKIGQESDLSDKSNEVKVVFGTGIFEKLIDGLTTTIDYYYEVIAESFNFDNEETIANVFSYETEGSVDQLCANNSFMQKVFGNSELFSFYDSEGYLDKIFASPYGRAAILYSKDLVPFLWEEQSDYGKRFMTAFESVGDWYIRYDGDSPVVTYAFINYNQEVDPLYFDVDLTDKEALYCNIVSKLDSGRNLEITIAEDVVYDKFDSDPDASTDVGVENSFDVSGYTGVCRIKFNAKYLSGSGYDATYFKITRIRLE